MTTSSAQRSSSDTFQREFDPSEGAHGTNVSWFDASPKSIDPSTRQLLETYSGIPTDRVEQHIVDVVLTLSALSSHLAISADSIVESEIELSKFIPTLAWDSFDSLTSALASRPSMERFCNESRAARSY